MWVARSQTGGLKALKVVRRDQFDSDQPFNREYTAIEKYEDVARGSSSLIDVLHVGKPADDFFYYVMPLADDLTGQRPKDVEGYSPLTLSALLEAGRMPVRESVSIIMELLHGLEVLHRAGLVHRDIKPGNIVFIDGKPVLADIGLVTETGPAVSNLGTSGFMAPEGPGKKGDLYSTGMTLYVMASGMPASDRLPAPTLRSKREREGYALLNQILLKACAERPARRYASAATLRKALVTMNSPVSPKSKRAAPRGKKNQPKVFRTKPAMQKHARSLFDKTVADIRKGYSYDEQFLTLSEIRKLTAVVKRFFRDTFGDVPAETRAACWWAEAVLTPDGRSRRALIQKASAGGSAKPRSISDHGDSSTTAVVVSPLSFVTDATKFLASGARLTYFSSLFARLQADPDAATRQALKYLTEGIEAAIDTGWAAYRAR